MEIYFWLVFLLPCVGAILRLGSLAIGKYPRTLTYVAWEDVLGFISNAAGTYLAAHFLMKWF